jgi:hypothetical protein
MTIPDPQFDLYELVTLHLNGKQYQGKITKRLFDPDEEYWSYQFNGVKELFTASVLSSRGTND